MGIGLLDKGSTLGRAQLSRTGTARVLLSFFATLPLSCDATLPESTGSGQSSPEVLLREEATSDSGVDGAAAEPAGDAELGGTFPKGTSTIPSALSAPSLGAASSFGVLAGSTVSNTGATTILEGDLGVAPGFTVTGFPPGLMQGGAIYAGDSSASQAQSDVTTAYGLLAAEPCTQDLSGHDLGGLTLSQGVYCFSSEARLTGALVLDAEENPSAVFVFQVASDLTTASKASVAVVRGGQFCRVFWRIGGSATVGADTAFAGNILANSNIALVAGASVTGRTLARNGAVTMDVNQIFDVRVAHSGSCVGPGSDVGSETSDY